MTHALLIGNPNCGKTTLFNALTNANQRVGNWPGVTVEKKTGEFLFGEHLIEITDLPGVYSLVANAEGISKDEQIAAQSVVDLEYDCIINVIDACHLERHLYLTSQLFELGKPVIVALNMMDIAGQRGISIDIKKLEDLLGCSVIPIQAHKNIGILALQQSLLHCSQQNKPLKLSLSVVAQHALDDLENCLLSEGYNNSLAYYFSRRIAEGDTLTGDKTLTENLIKLKETDQNLDVLLADARYQKIHEIVTLVQKRVVMPASISLRNWISLFCIVF